LDRDACDTSAPWGSDAESAVLLVIFAPAIRDDLKLGRVLSV
jgi:hypothetical protein